MTVDSHIWTSMRHSVRTYPAKAVLLEAGRCATKVFVVKSGLLRMWFDQDGRDVTMQFFFEGSPVCSVESFIKGTPSEFDIGTVEPCKLLVIDRQVLTVLPFQVSRRPFALAASQVSGGPERGGLTTPHQPVIEQSFPIQTAKHYVRIQFCT